MTIWTALSIGDEVVLTHLVNGYGIGSGRWREIESGQVGRITRVNTSMSIVRFTGYAYEPDVSFWVENDYFDLITVDPNRPVPRKLGEVPEGMISPDDPRLDWLWDDAAKIAKQQNYCGQFQTITEKLGIPPRPKKFHVEQTIGELTISASFMARNVEEAQAMLEAKMAEAISTGE